MKKPIINDSGLTVRELKMWIGNLKEKDDYGDDYTVWVGASGLSNIAIRLSVLNTGDIIFDTRDDVAFENGIK
jgi:hypothetical protein